MDEPTSGMIAQGVPLLDLRPQFDRIREKLEGAIARVAASQRFILGSEVELFERQFAEYLGAEHAIGCASGTDALLLSLLTLNLQPGDEVITSPFTFFATAGAIHNAGGTPVFADIDPETFNLNPACARATITERTRAIVPVHLFGQVAAMGAFLRMADEHGIAVVEDAAQAVGARREDRGVTRAAGVLGLTGAFSFFPSKNLGAWGDGGMVTTNDEAVAAHVRRLRKHGGDREYHHEEIGTNSRLDALQAAILSVKLEYLPEWNEARRVRAKKYAEAFHDVPEIVAPVTAAGCEHVYHQYTVRADRRAELMSHLKAEQIGHKVYYPVPLHLQPCFSDLGYRKGSLPEAERAAGEVLSLPIFPELTAVQQDRVVESVKGFYL